MTAIRTPGKINEDTWLIDIGMLGVYGVTAVYLIRGERTCLIDAGTRSEAPRLIKLLKALDAFPPDVVIITHPHYDHAQGLPVLQREASRVNQPIEILAGHDAILPLADPTFNDPFKRGPYQSIGDVRGVREGDALDLGGISLRFYDVPGHCCGHLAILDEKNRNLFVGDALGDKVADDLFLPPFMPPTWDAAAFLSSVSKLKPLDYATLCLSHFGCIGGSEAHSILDEAIATYRAWWEVYDRNAERLNDPDYLLKIIRQELNPGIPKIQPTSLGLQVLFNVVSAISTVVGKKTVLMDKVGFGDTCQQLAIGYRMAIGQSLR